MKKWRERKREDYPEQGDCSVMRRWYSPVDADWPLIRLSIHESIGGWKVSHSHKTYPESWWSDQYGLPQELIAEFADMLRRWAEGGG